MKNSKFFEVGLPAGTVILLMLFISIPGAFAQPTSTATLTTKSEADFARKSEFYSYGYTQWSDQAKKEKAAGNSEAAIAATNKALAWYEAMLVAELAETKAGITGGEVILLPTPGTWTTTSQQQDNGGIKVVGELDPAINIHKDDHDSLLSRLYKDYMFAMRYWYGQAASAKRINDAAEVQTAVRNAQAFEAAYLAIKNAEIKAQAAAVVVVVTPVSGLPHYPAAAAATQQASIVPGASAPPAVAPVPTPASAPTPVAITQRVAATTTGTSSTVTQPSPTKVVELSDGSFAKTTLDGIWVVEFGASWCGPCVAMKPILDQLSTELEASVKFGTVDVDENKAYLKRYKVRAYPTFVLIKNGTVVATQIGGMSKQKLLAFATQ